jgi:hypothetical protein
METKAQQPVVEESDDVLTSDELDEMYEEFGEDFFDVDPEA